MLALPVTNTSSYDLPTTSTRCCIFPCNPRPYFPLGPSLHTSPSQIPTLVDPAYTFQPRTPASSFLTFPTIPTLPLRTPVNPPQASCASISVSNTGRSSVKPNKDILVLVHRKIRFRSRRILSIVIPTLSCCISIPTKRLSSSSFRSSIALLLDVSRDPAAIGLFLPQYGYVSLYIHPTTGCDLRAQIACRCVGTIRSSCISLTFRIHILEAVRLGLVPRVTRRLTGHERSMIRPGTVWVWEEGQSISSSIN